MKSQGHLDREEGVRQVGDTSEGDLSSSDVGHRAGVGRTRGALITPLPAVVRKEMGHDSSGTTGRSLG